LGDSDNDDMALDTSGFNGDFYRKKEKLFYISEDDFYKILCDNEKNFIDVMRTIRTIDKDHNGYITTTELDDIIKLNFI
jgi:Ca2+-binding EF-hand superfamily protein